MNVHTLASDFRASFSQEAERYFFSPGRVNLIGEHSGYIGEHVLSCPITIGTYGAVCKRNDRLVRLFSKNYSEQGIIEFSLNELGYLPSHGWANYPKGLLHFLQEKGTVLNEGFDLFISGNIPHGVGLSSSTSLLILVGEMISKLYNLYISRTNLIQICNTVESSFIGINGILMDFFPAAVGKTNHGILLDCHTLNYDYIPLNLQHYNMVLMNTNTRNELSDSICNERRNECEHALRHFQGALNILSLEDLNPEQFENFKYLITNVAHKKRARHIVSEKERSMVAVKELKRGNLEAFGSLMNQSHQSLRDDYEVSGVELDTLVEAARLQPGVLGAKMIGSGFGGCAVALVDRNEINQFIENVGEIYKVRLGYPASFYVASIGDGVKELSIRSNEE